MTQSKLNDEAGRLAALQRYNVLGTPPEAPFDRITGLVRTLFNVPIALVTLADAHRLWFLSRQGIGATEMPRANTMCHFAIRTAEPLVVRDARLDMRFSSEHFVMGPPYVTSYAGVPLVTPDGYNIGALCVIDTVPREFSPEQVALLKSFAPLVIGELELRAIAKSDHLTGALTRRGFLAEADAARALFERHRRPRTLVMLDIDHFKAVNDGYGHPAGDAVLRTVVAACRGALREEDVLGRIGGEEFAMLLAETGPAEAMAAAERFRALVERVEIPLDPPLRVTASFGVAPLAPGFVTSEAWLAEADAALYAAKRAGRNCCRLAQPVLHSVAA
jgi:diguanylate cyclase (GGDEF)-like protein